MNSDIAKTMAAAAPLLAAGVAEAPVLLAAAVIVALTLASVWVGVQAVKSGRP